MTDDELYRALGALTREKASWPSQIPHVASLLEGHSPKIMAKALWLLGEIGLRYPKEITSHVAKVAAFLESPDALLRERALNALGRIGRARYESVEPWMNTVISLAMDDNPRVRLAFVWASENIATNNPDVYCDHMQPFAALLCDADNRVRMEAPEMFRVMGKRLPQQVEPYLDTLRWKAEHDANEVVRIHCAGAIRATCKALENKLDN